MLEVQIRPVPEVSLTNFLNLRVEKQQIVHVLLSKNQINNNLLLIIVK